MKNALLATLATTTAATRVTYYVKHQPQHVATLLSQFHEVSDPKHPSYGKHLSLAQVVELQRPLESDLAAVREHIQRAGGVEIGVSAAADKINDVLIGVSQSKNMMHSTHEHTEAGLTTTANWKEQQKQQQQWRQQHRGI